MTGMEGSPGGYSSDKNRRLRVLLLARVFPPRVGGIENWIYNIYSRLHGRYELMVVTPKTPGWRSCDAVQPFRIVRTPKMPVIGERYKAPLVGMLAYGTREIFRFRPQQLHCDQVDSALIARVLAAFNKAKYVVFAHGMEITDGNLPLAKKWALSRAQAVIANSSCTRHNVRVNFGVRDDRIHVIPPGVDVSKFNPQLNGERVRHRHGLGRRRVILTVGRLVGPERNKGHDAVIRCLPEVLISVPDAVYVIVGDGPDKARLQELVNKFGLARNVVFAGYVREDELPEYYAACDVFVMLSRDGRSKHGGTLNEGFGIVFLEASACGKPVIGGRSGGIADAVADGVSGFLVDPLDTERAAKMIVEILSDQEMALRLGEQGRAWAEGFSWDVAASRVARVVDGLVLPA